MKIKITICILFCISTIIGVAQNKPKGNTSLSVSTSNLVIAYKGEEKRISVNSNTSFFASSPEAWLHIYKYADYVKIVCESNPSTNARRGSVQIETSNGAKKVSVSVYQYGSPYKAITLSPWKVTDNGNGRAIKITVSTTASFWGIKDLPYWCSYKDKTTNSFTLIINQNTLKSRRTGNFTVYAGESEEVVSVEQEVYAGFVTDQEELKFSNTPISKRLYVGCIENWKHSCPRWIKLEWVSRSGDPNYGGYYIVNVENNYGVPRTSKITLKSESGKYMKEITVKQDGATKYGYPDFFVVKKDFYVSAEGGYYDLDIYLEDYVRLSDCWTNSNWLEEEQLQYGGGQFHVKKNRTRKERTAILSIKDTRGNVIQVTVRQAAK